MNFATVLVRTYSAGVHVGTLVEREGMIVTLRDARRVWRWRGANTLNELATKGAAQEYTRISEPVVEIILDAVEIIRVEDAAEANLKQSRWGA